jgi:MFS family permease
MVTWGLAASAMMLVRTPSSFYALRFLLGVAEAGFFPGIIFYLTYWYPAQARARTYAWFLAAIPVCGVIGGPLSGALLGLDGRLGLRGWQWLFLLEGIRSCGCCRTARATRAGSGRRSATGSRSEWEPSGRTRPRTTARACVGRSAILRYGGSP